MLMPAGLKRRLGVAERIEFLSHQAEDLIAEKRRRIEAQLWAIHEADIGDCFETIEVAKSKDGKVQTYEAGKMLTVKKQRAKLLSDLPPELRKAIEDVTVDRPWQLCPKALLKGPSERWALQAAQSRCAGVSSGKRYFTAFRCRAAPAIGPHGERIGRQNRSELQLRATPLRHRDRRSRQSSH